MTPGQVRNLKVEVNPDTQSTHSAIFTFDNPANIQSATDPDDKSVQYIIENCIYNRFLKTSQDCAILTEILANASANSQTTLKKSSFYFSNIQPTKTKELLFKVTGVSLNGTHGPTAELIKRLDPSSRKYNVCKDCQEKQSSFAY